MKGDVVTLMDTWNLRENSNFKTRISRDLHWVPANCLNNYQTKNHEHFEEPHNLYELLFLFQNQGLEECYDDKILIADAENALVWEYFDSPSKIVKHYKKGHCAVFSLWLSYYLNKMYDDCGYIEIIRNKNKSWHVINYVHLDNMYYIVDPSIYIKKYSKIIPIEDGKFTTYANSNIITGGVLQTSNLENFVSYYQKYVALAQNSYLFIKFNTYELPCFSINGVNNKYSVYYPNDIELNIIGKYDSEIYNIIQI